MAYTVHNFEQGDVLYAEQLNEMDEQIAANEENINNSVSFDMLAENYSANKTYSIGDYVIYDNELYTCIYEITAPEGWNSTHWRIANLGDGIGDLNRQLSDTKSALNITAEVENYNWILLGNLFDKNNPLIKANTQIAYNGYSALNGFYVSHPIKLEKDATYKISKPSGYGNLVYAALVGSYGEINEVISLTYSDGVAEYTAPNDTYICVNLGVNFSNFKFCKSEDYDNPAKAAYNRESKWKVDWNKISNPTIKTDDCAFIKSGNNLFNKDSSGIRSDTYISYSGFAPLSGYYVSEPIKLNANTTYKWNATGGIATTSYVATVTLSGDLISTEEVTKSDGYIEYTPVDDVYICFNLGNTDLSTVMFCEKSKYPTNYESYRIYPEGLSLSDEMTGEVEAMLPSSKLNGKTLAVTGDSICYGLGASGGYGAIIAARNNMVFQNVGESGGTIKAETYSGTTPRFWICRSISSMRSDADYILLEGGVNDGLGNIGTLSSGYDAELDDTTLYGACESMFKQAILRFPGKKIGYIFAHKCTTSFSSNGDQYNPYYVIMDCCKKWGIPYIDLNTLVPPIGFVDALKDVYTANGDGWHPNAAGYTAFYVPLIESFMNSL